jgi:hypothetical protein
MNKLRKEMMEYIIKLSNDMDPSGKNAKRYQGYFEPMADKEFFKFMKTFMEDEDINGLNFKIAYTPYEDTRPVEFYEKVATSRGVKMEETVYMPFLNNSSKEEAFASTQQIFTGYVPVKRLAQRAMKKNASSTSITDRNMETGQVKDEDKNGRVSDVEVSALLAQNQYHTAIEYMNPRADDMQMKRQMLTAIREKGEVSLEELDSDVMNKVALNTMNYYVLGSGLNTNIIESSGLVLPITLRGREESKNTQTIKSK